MIIKIYTLKDLIKTGLKIFDSCISPDTEIGEPFLQSKVISKWDWSDYSNYYTYFDNNNIHHVVNVCSKIDDKTTKGEHLKKDFSNIETIKKKMGGDEWKDFPVKPTPPKPPQKEWEKGK